MFNVFKTCSTFFSSRLKLFSTDSKYCNSALKFCYMAWKFRNPGFTICEPGLEFGSRLIFRVKRSAAYHCPGWAAGCLTADLPLSWLSSWCQLAAWQLTYHCPSWAVGASWLPDIWLTIVLAEQLVPAGCLTASWLTIVLAEQLVPAECMTADLPCWAAGASWMSDSWLTIVLAEHMVPAEGLTADRQQQHPQHNAHTVLIYSSAT